MLPTSSIHPFEGIKQFINSLPQRLEEFYASFENEDFGQRVVRIDKENQSVIFRKDFYLNGELENTSISFINNIKPVLKGEIAKSKLALIKGFETNLESRKSYEDYASKQRKELNELLNDDILQQYSLVQLDISKIVNFIKSYEGYFDGVEENYVKSYFGLKQGYYKRHFDKLYNVCIRLDLIDDNISEYDFFEVFISENTDKYIKFTCNTPYMVYFLKSISPLFHSFDEKNIEKSRRFLTRSKKETFLIAGNYRKSLSRAKTKEKQLLLARISEEIENCL